MKTPKVSIIILNWNGWRNTIKCLESIYQISYQNYDVIVVDNCSVDESVERIKAYADQNNKLIKVLEYLGGEFEFASEWGLEMIGTQPSNTDLILIKATKNLGYAAGNNIGIRYALNRAVDYILILNNDTIVQENFLNQLINVAEQDTRIGTVGPKILSFNGEIQRACSRMLPSFWDFIFVYSFIGERLFKENIFWREHFYYDYNFDSPRLVEVLSGSCMLFKRNAIQDLGLMDEHTFLYFEECIIGVKLKKLGWKSMVNPNSVIIHLGGESIKNLKSWARYWSKKSEIYFLERYSTINRLQKTLILTVLFMESLLALILSLCGANKGNFNIKYEFKILKFLVSKIIK
jgi:GT2 family glycosyltransferase